MMGSTSCRRARSGATRCPGAALWQRHPGLTASRRGRLGRGPACVVLNEGDLVRVGFGDVLVTPVAGPALAVVLPRVGAVVAELGGSTSHLAALARERGMPAVLGVAEATRRIRDGRRWRSTVSPVPSELPGGPRAGRAVTRQPPSAGARDAQPSVLPDHGVEHLEVGADRLVEIVDLDSRPRLCPDTGAELGIARGHEGLVREVVDVALAKQQARLGVDDHLAGRRDVARDEDAAACLRSR